MNRLVYPPSGMVAPSKITGMAALNALQHFIGPSQRHAVISAMRGEERQYFTDTLERLAWIVTTMPKTYEQDGKGEQAIAYLHYFAGGQASWWITEKDAGSPDDEIQCVQKQAFGLADLFGDGGEVGYISIAEILSNGGELDFHFTPKTLAEIRGKQLVAS